MDQLEIFLKLNTGGEVSGSAGVGSKIVEGAKKIIGYKKGVGDMCAILLALPALYGSCRTSSMPKKEPRLAI